MTEAAVGQPVPMHLLDRSRSIESLLADVRHAGPVYQRALDLVAHVVGAHAAALERLVTMTDDPTILEDDPDLREVLWVHRFGGAEPEQVDRYGHRIDSLLSAIEQSALPELAATAARLAAEVGDLYGVALARAFELLHGDGQTDAIRAAIADDLVSSLLVVHGLHPRSLADRVRDCLADLATTLPEHGGLVELVGIDGDVVTIRITGGSDIHRWRTRLAAERAIDHAAPDHAGIVVIGARTEPAPVPLTTFIPVDALRRTAKPRTPRRWLDLPELAELADGDVRCLSSDGVSLVACNVGGDLYLALDPFATDGSPGDGLRLVAGSPPVVEAADGRRLVFDAPLPVQRTDETVEVMVP